MDTERTLSFPENLLYTEDHFWLARLGDSMRLGITDFAQGELGDIVFVDLPPEGSQLRAGESFGSIESIKVLVELSSPVSGEITARNTLLEEKLELLNTDPYDSGWLIEFQPGDQAALKGLMSHEQYLALIGQ